jgi:Tol biopolymer transport system component
VFAATLDGQTEPDLYTIEPDGTALTRLTTTDAAELYPSWSPDHRHISYVRDFQLFVSDGFGRNEVRIAEHTGKQRTINDSVYSETLGPAAWSPDSTKLAYLYPRPSNFIDNGTPEQPEIVDNAAATTIHFVRADGTGDHPIELDPGFSINSLAWANAEMISFSQADDCADCAGGGFYGFADTDGEPYRAFHNDPASPNGPSKHLDWSNDGSRWVYVGGLDYFGYERADAIYVSASSGIAELSEPRLIRDLGWNPRWSPDDRAIAHIGSDGIYVVDPTGANPRRIVLGTIRGLDW